MRDAPDDLMRTMMCLFLAATSTTAVADTKAPTTTIDVTSSAFSPNGAIPKEYSCEGKSTSPPLAWSSVPANTRSVAILVEDPDAPRGTVTHWIVTNLRPSTHSLGAGAALPDGALQAENSKGARGYMGPCPPSGTHHYHFKVFALDTPVTATTRSELLGAINGHIVAQGELIGTYQKSS